MPLSRVRAGKLAVYAVTRAVKRPAQWAVALGLLGCRAPRVDKDSLSVAAMPGSPSDAARWQEMV